MSIHQSFVTRAARLLRNRTERAVADVTIYVVKSMCATFDALNRVSIAQDPDAKLTTFQFDADSRRTTLIDSNGSSRKYQYDAVGNLTTQIEYNAVGTPIITMIDSYDAVQNRTGRAKDGVVTTWIYDTGYRLLSQQTAGAHATFVYDNSGNALVKWQEGTNPMSFTYDNANRIVTMLQGTDLTTYSFDANGCQTVENKSGAITTNVFDYENRLIEIQLPADLPSTYTYSGGDGLRRTSNEKGAGIVTIIWDGSDYLGEY